MSKKPNRRALNSSGEERNTSADKALQREKKTGTRASKKMFFESTGHSVNRTSQPTSETSPQKTNDQSPPKLDESIAPNAVTLNRNYSTSELGKCSPQEPGKAPSHKSDAPLHQYGSGLPVKNGDIDLSSSASRSDNGAKQKPASEKNIELPGGTKPSDQIQVSVAESTVRAFPHSLDVPPTPPIKQEEQPEMNAKCADVQKMSTHRSPEPVYLLHSEQTEKMSNLPGHGCVNNSSAKTGNDSVSAPGLEHITKLAHELNDEAGAKRNVTPAVEFRHCENVVVSHGSDGTDKVDHQRSTQYSSDQQIIDRAAVCDGLRHCSKNDQDRNINSQSSQSIAEAHAAIVSKLLNNADNVVITWARQLANEHHLSFAQPSFTESTASTFTHREDCDIQIRSNPVEKIEPMSKAKDNFAPDLMTAKASDRQLTARRNCIYISQKRMPERRYIMGIEVALAAVIAAAGARRAHSQPENEASSEYRVTPKGTDKTMSSASIASADGPEDKYLSEKSSLSLAAIRKEHRSNKTEECLPPELSYRAGKTSGQKDEPIILPATPTVNGTIKEPQSNDVNRTKKVNPVAKRPTTFISSGDTLISIAERFFDNPNVAWLIADLNVEQAKESWIDEKRIVEFKNRQPICLPVDQEIAEFLLNRPKHARPENLITIVQKTQIDRELLESSWRPVVGGAGKEGRRLLQNHHNWPSKSVTSKQFYLTPSPHDQGLFQSTRDGIGNTILSRMSGSKSKNTNFRIIKRFF